jgi:hypothetical protein
MASPVKNRFNWRMFHGRGSGVQRKKKNTSFAGEFGRDHENYGMV